MPTRIRMMFLAMTFALLLIPVVQLYSTLGRRSDIWWTPSSMLVPFSESGDRVRVHIRGKPLDALLDAGQLRLADDGSTNVVTPADVGFRFNNWDRVRAQRIPVLLVYGASIGAGLVLLLLLATDKLAYRPERV